MNIIKITHFDTANGNGIRTVVWVSGCNHHCEGCHNPNTWNPNIGVLFSDNHKKDIWESLSNPFIEGVTFSGGDPLYPSNRPDISLLVKDLKKDFPTKTIWVYTGYSWEEIKNLELMKYVNVLVDGKFEKNLKDITLPYCGSKNQRVIDVQKTLETNKIILWK